MFCPNCGKPVKDYDNFCRYCGVDLRVKQTEHSADSVIETEDTVSKTDFSETNNNDVSATKEDTKTVEIPIDDTSEEYVLYDIKKHYMALFWTAFLTPIFILYFWRGFLYTHSIISWFIVIALLAFIVYPVLRYKSDSIVVTNKYAHIKTGLVKPFEVDIPINDFSMFDVTQTFLGRILGYGTIIFFANAQRYEYQYVAQIDSVQRILSDPKKFIK